MPEQDCQRSPEGALAALAWFRKRIVPLPSYWDHWRPVLQGQSGKVRSQTLFVPDQCPGTE